MVGKALMRRRPGQGGCCGCSLGVGSGLLALALAGIWSFAHRTRRRDETTP